MNYEVPFTFKFTDLPTKKSPLRKESNILPYVGRPADNIINLTLEQYYNSIIEDYEDMQENMKHIIIQDASGNKIPYEKKSEDIDPEDLYAKLNTVIEKNIKCLYVAINYPLNNPTMAKFKCDHEITYGLILYLTTVAYQQVYITEEQDDCDPGTVSPTCDNRAESNGRFGIWGHTINQLVYNGYSGIEIYDNYIICELDCDS
jgi:hypothetical protein